MNGVLRVLAGVLAASLAVWGASALGRRELGGRFAFLVWAALLAGLAMPMVMEAVRLPTIVLQVDREQLAGQAPGRRDEGPATQKRATSSGAEADMAQTDDEMDRSAGAAATAIVVAWLAGTAARTVITIVGYNNMRAEVNASKAQCAMLTQVVFRQTLEKSHARGQVWLQVVADLDMPGLLLPETILLPERMQRLGGHAIELAISHELTRLERGARLLYPLLAALECVWWFNPVVWRAARKMREDFEAMCRRDMAMSLNASDRAAYERLLARGSARPGARRASAGTMDSASARWHATDARHAWRTRIWEEEEPA